MNTFRHYLRGLLFASWNGGISALVAVLGVDGAAMSGLDHMLDSTSQPAHVLNVHEMLSAFLGACFIHGLLWLKAHPLPETAETVSPFAPQPPKNSTP